MIDSPVLLITFNRPETTKRVFEAIKIAKPSKLYVFNDGPRLGNIQDLMTKVEILNILNYVDWECKLYTLFLDNNLGCGLGVVTAINWAFENEDSLIILEDDCLPGISFFHFSNYLLKKYKEDSRICMISGNNYTEKNNYTADSYFFSKYGHIWGWATWKRVWVKYDYEMKDWPNLVKTNNLKSIFKNKLELNFMKKYFDRIYNIEEKGTWDHQWFFCRIKEYGLSIIPSYNLVTNIGFFGVHTDKKSSVHLIPINENFVIKNEPLFVLCNIDYDNYHFKRIIYKKRNIFMRVYRKIKKTKFWKNKKLK